MSKRTDDWTTYDTQTGRVISKERDNTLSKRLLKEAEKVVEQCKRFGGNPEVIQPEVDLEKAAKEFAHNYDMGTCDEIAQDCFKAGAEWQREQYECIPAEEEYMRGFAQGAKEERESLSHTMLTYAADIFSGKMLLDDISYSYRGELADYFRDLAELPKEG